MPAYTEGLQSLNLFQQEEFVKRLAEAGYQQTVSENRQHIQYRDMCMFVPHILGKYN